MQESPLCACGCKEIVSKTHRGKYNTYINGHNSKGINNPFLGKTHSKEMREYLSAKAKTRPPISEETRNKISAAGKGRIVSEQTRKKCSVCRIREKNPMWKGGIRYTKGRVFFKIEGRKWPIARARKVMEDFLGRVLLSTEIVHHVNGITDDDRIENLVITNRIAHAFHHHKGA